MKEKWRKADDTAAETLMAASLKPGQICCVGTSCLPQGFHTMHGVTSYFVSAHTAPVCAPGITIAGEMVVVRRDEEVAKAYNYAFATSSGESAYFIGPFTNFSLHHMASTSDVAVPDLFGHTPWKTTP